MVLYNPKNWHWVDKDASAWTEKWLKGAVAEVAAEEGNVTAKVAKVVSLDGDINVSQYKGKVITLYGFKLVLEYSGNVGEEQASGTITVPDVAHDTAEDEFVFEIDIYSESKEKQSVKDLVRSRLVPQLRKEFLKLPAALIEAHGKDIQHAPGEDPSSGFATPRYLSQTSTPKPAELSASSQTAVGGGSLVNTVTVTDSEEFRTTAEELFQTFTDPARLAAFTRAPPKVFEGAREGGKFELFGGNVSGEYLVLDAPKMIVQSWRLNQWPQGHHSRLQIEFDQNNVDHVTVMRVTWTGVPVGQEDVTKRNWGEYYVRSIKTTFGFGTVL